MTVGATSRTTAALAAALAVGGIALAPAALAATPTVGDGGFEDHAFSGSYVRVAPGDTSGVLAPWTVLSGNVDLVGNLWTAGQGADSLDLAGSVPGAIRQPLTTIPGHLYSVSFLYTASPDGTPTAINTFRVDVGSARADLSAPARGETHADPGWLTGRLSWTATSTTTTLTFTDTDGTADFGPLLDGVSVLDETASAALPEAPAAAALAAGGLLAGAGTLALRRRRRAASF